MLSIQLKKLLPALLFGLLMLVGQFCYAMHPQAQQGKKTILASNNGCPYGLEVSRDNGATWTNYTEADGLGSRFINGIYADGSYIYVATIGGLSIGTRDQQGILKFTNYTTADGLGSNKVNLVYVDDNQTIYASTNGGLSIGTRDQQGILKFTNDPTLKPCQGIFVDKDHTIYVTFSGNKFATKKTSETEFTTHTLGADSSINEDIYVTDDHNIYIANFHGSSADDSGLFIKFNGTQDFIKKGKQDGLNDNNISAIYASDDNTIYASTHHGLSVSTDGGKTFQSVKDPILDHTSVLDVFVDSDGTIYAATEYGLFASTDKGGYFYLLDSASLHLANAIFVIEEK